MATSHVVITGTGRSGTTFLVQILTKLGLDTGFAAESLASQMNKIANAGLEYDIRDANCPYIVKSPWFCDYAGEIINSNKIILNHVFIPVRDLFSAAESRREVVRKNRKRIKLKKQGFREYFRQLKNFNSEPIDGGTVHTRSLKKGRQEQVLLNQIYNLIYALSDSEVPVTLMCYPRLTKDSNYLYNKLKPILGDITYEQFNDAFLASVRKELVHEYSS